MIKLSCLLIVAIPLLAVDVTVSVDGRSQTFSVTQDDLDSLNAMRAQRADPEQGNTCPSTRPGGRRHACATDAQYLMWSLKNVFNVSKDRFPRGADATDQAEIDSRNTAKQGRQLE